MSTQVFLVRHGETTWNLAGKLQGHLESRLTATGIAQAQALAEHLQHQPFAAVYSSDLKRAYQTAQYIVNKNQHTIIKKPSLRERNLGIFQGLTRELLCARFPEAFQAYQTQPQFIIPQGESLQGFHQRCITCLEEIAACHLGQSILIVSHGGVLTALLKHTLSIPLVTPRRFDIANTSVNIFSYTQTHWTLRVWGSLTHWSLEEQVLASE